jgi:hypothetical protein
MTKTKPPEPGLSHHTAHQKRVAEALGRFYDNLTPEMQDEAHREEARKRRPKSDTPSETKEQIAVCRWLWAKRLVYFAVPNGSWLRNPQKQGAILRDMGLRPGVPDLLVLSVPPGQSFKALGLEMKRRTGGKLSEAQEKWRDIMRDVGWYWVVGYGCDDAIEKLEELGY